MIRCRWECNEQVRRFAACLLIVAIVPITLGCQAFPVPDQSQYASLSSLEVEGEAIVRLYLAPIPCLETIAVHPWFAVKGADSSTFDRWEVYPFTGDDTGSLSQAWGHVWKNSTSQADEWNNGGQYVLAELTGEEAEAVIQFIEANSPTYACKDTYILFPGPNSNTYAQWVIDNTAWDIELPPTAIGKDIPATCG